MAQSATRRKKGADANPAPVEVKRDPGTKSGVVNPESKHNKDRLSRADQIADGINKKRMEELGLDPDTGEPKVPGAPDPSSAPDLTEQQAEQQTEQTQGSEQEEQAEQKSEQTEQTAQTEQQAEQKTEKMVTLIVDGKRIEKPESEVFEAGQRALQKESAADARLERATMLLKKAEQGLDTSASPDPGQQQNTDPSAQDDLALARQIQMGTEQEAAAAIATLKSRGIDPASLSRNVEDRVLARMKFESIRDTYKDVLDDPYLSQLAVTEDRKMVDEGDERLPHERLPEIAEKLRKWRGPQGKDVQVNLDGNKQHKAQSGDSVTAAAGKKTAPDKEDKPLTQAEIINEIRKSRGQSPIPG